MAESRGRFEWNMTSSVMAIICNVNIASNSKKVSPDAFNPYAKKKKPTVPLSFLKEVFCKG
jgi:hypothetical protein